MGSPVTPPDLDAAVPSVFSNICSSFKSLFLLGPLMKEFWHWAFEDNGDATPEFKALFASIGVPTGGLIDWPIGVSIPDGFLAANGQIVSAALYPGLLAVYGSTFGGDGTSTVGLPNIEGRFRIGASAVRAVGSTGGSDNTSLTVANLAEHTHRPVAIAQGPSAYNHIWGSSPAGAGGAGVIYPGGGGLGGPNANPIDTTLEATGSGTAFSILPSYFAAIVLVKT